MKAGLLLGGNSPEREVSLTSGEQVEAALRRGGFAPLVVDTREGDWLRRLQEAGVGRVFNILHGGAGENGEVRGALNCAGVASTGSGVLGMALAMNKDAAKRMWRAAGVPTADWRVAQSAAAAAGILAELSPPFFVKPVCGGSSGHSSVVRTAGELAAALETALAEGSGALVEQLIEGEEYTLSVVDNKPLPLIRIRTARAFYDYTAKYVDDDTEFACPCGLPAAKEKELAALGMKAFFALHCSHWGRVDFMLQKNGAPQFLEVNTVPGMTSHSLVPLAAKTAGVDFDALVANIMNGAALENENV